MNRIGTMTLMAALNSGCATTSREIQTDDRSLGSEKQAGVSIQCDSSCTKSESDGLEGVAGLVNQVETSDCFLNFFRRQAGKIHESQGKTPEVIVAELRTKNTVLVQMYDLPWYQHLRFWNIPCGDDGADGHIRMTHACWNAYTPELRAAFVGHEEAHKAGYTHLEHGNTSKGNEQSVPYLVNSAFEECLAPPK